MLGSFDLYTVEFLMIMLAYLCFYQLF